MSKFKADLMVNLLTAQPPQGSSNMILTLDRETLFKVTAHSLPRGTLWVKYKPDWTKERKNLLQKSDGQMVEWTDTL